MTNPIRSSILDLFLATNADDLAKPENFAAVVQNFTFIQRTLNKVRFLENIESVLDKNGITSMNLGYDYESNDEGGSYISYSISDAVLADGRDYEEVEDDLYDVPYELEFDYLEENVATSLVESGPISKERIPAIRKLLLGAPEMEVLDYFKISREQAAIDKTTPQGKKASDKALKV